MVPILGGERYRSYRRTDLSKPAYYSTLKTEAARSSKTSGNIYQTTRRHASEGCNLHTHSRGDLRSHNNNSLKKCKDSAVQIFLNDHI
jgi:hypothetical protein